ncbi:MAG TPA: Crp/Fnr family transcriptional regulator [Caulobacteraceae bacterium]|nr:Crp/Fnr family transcriptional regulator [Caulobacteraceae bacterium]
MSAPGNRVANRRKIEPVLRRLNGLHPLNAAESELVDRLGAHAEEHRPGAELTAQGSSHPVPRLMLSGWACRQRLLPDGRRQIFGFVLPGDLISFYAQSRPLTQVSITALTRVETADASALKAAALDGGAYPALARIMAATASQDEERLLDHVVRLGRHTAYERVAHLLLELRERLAAAGLGDDRRFPLPITQEALADALGLSVVHINRILQQLRRERLIEMRTGQVVLLDPNLLNQVSDYQPPTVRDVS